MGEKKEAEGNPWSLDRGKPKKIENVGFSFGALDEEETKEPDKTESTFNFGFTTASTKKDKKKNKKGVFGTEDPAEENSEPTPAAVEEPPVEDHWGAGWGAPKAKKGKGKKSAVESDSLKVEAKAEELAPAAEDERSAFTTATKAKKGKKGAAEEIPKVSANYFRSLVKHCYVLELGPA